MTDTTRFPERARFSLLYLRQGLPGSDSKRMRKRLGALINDREPEGLSRSVRAKLGVDVTFGSGSAKWVKFFEEAELRDVLDAITLAYDATEAGRHTTEGVHVGPQTLSTQAYFFLQEVNRIVQEEHLRYRADYQGVVHFAVDAEFEASRAATLAGLGQSRFANAANNFNEAYEELSKTPTDGKGAIRAVFDAAENVFRVMYSNEPRLTASAARTRLTAVVQQLYKKNPPATRAGIKLIESFCDWIDGCHNYRHEHSQEHVIEPPLEIVVEYVSSGASYLRWLIEIDAQTNKPGLKVVAR